MAKSKESDDKTKTAESAPPVETEAERLDRLRRENEEAAAKEKQ